MKDIYLFYSLVLVSLNMMLSSCANDDSNNFFNPCDIDPFPGIENVLQSGISVTPVIEDDGKGYLVKATITNMNDETVRGAPSFVLRTKEEIRTYSNSSTANSTTCTRIDSNSSCEFETFFKIFDEDKQVDANVEFLCFYYFDN